MSVNEDLTPEEYVRIVAGGELWQLLDVREAWEIRIARISGTIDIPMNQVAQQLEQLNPSLPVAVLCHSGVRSARVAAHLAATGFARVANILGGIDAWSQTVDPEIPRY